MVPDNDPELADAALAALLIAARREGAWHQGWTDAPTAVLARRTTDQLAAVFTATSTGTISNCPWNPWRTAGPSPRGRNACIRRIPTRPPRTSTDHTTQPAPQTDAR